VKPALVVATIVELFPLARWVTVKLPLSVEPIPIVGFAVIE
jgi:hypothetical protein